MTPSRFTWNPAIMNRSANSHAPTASILNMIMPMILGVDAFCPFRCLPSGIMPPISLFSRPTRCGLIRFYRRIYEAAPVTLYERRGG